jgi:hypothetical protein
MAMSKLGYKYPKTEIQHVDNANDKQVTHYPSLCIYENIPEELADLDVEQKVKCEVILLVKRKSVRDDGDKIKRDIEFDVLAIGNVGNPKGKSKDEFLAMDPDEREEYQRKSVMEDDPEDY